MKRIGRDAVLDEASVRDADQRKAEWRRPYIRPTRPARAEVTIVTVHPEVWAEALRLAGGTASRIEVHSEYNVTVHNRPWRTTKRTGNR